MGKGTSKAGGGTSAVAFFGSEKALQAHFDAENKRIDEFMDGRSGSIEMKNGQILEHYTSKEMLNDILKDAKSNGEMYRDNAISIRYNNGDIVSYVEGDDTSKMKLTDIAGVIYDNDNTTAYSGKGIEIVNYKQLYPADYPDSKGYEDSWRIQFTKGRR